MSQGVSHGIERNVDPTVSDDITKGIKVNTMWTNISADLTYQCTNNNAGAAKWQPVNFKSIEPVITTLNPTKSDGAYSTIPEMFETIDIAGTVLRVEVSINLLITRKEAARLRIRLDGVPVGDEIVIGDQSANGTSDLQVFPEIIFSNVVVPGNRFVAVEWKTENAVGTITALETKRHLRLTEVAQ